MPVNFHYDSEHKVAIITIKGQVNLDELKSIASNFLSSDNVPSDTNALYNLRELNLSNIDMNFELSFIQFRETLTGRGNAKIAMVVEGNEGFGMGRMYEMLSSHLPQEIHIFKSMDEAYTWLQTLD